MTRVVDYSFARPDPAFIKARGYVGAMRYLGFGSKVLTPAERDRLFAAGLDIGLVWETTATRMDGGYGAGVSDAHTARGQADALGFPSNRPLYFANDQNRATGAHVDYMRGVHDVLGVNSGPYGSTALCDAAAALGCGYGWKVQTWGPPTGNANLQQMPNVAPDVQGTDVNDVLKPDWGQWHGSGSTTDPTNASPEDEMIWLLLHLDGKAFDAYYVAGGYVVRQFGGGVGAYGVPQSAIDFAAGKIEMRVVTGDELNAATKRTANAAITPGAGGGGTGGSGPTADQIAQRVLDLMAAHPLTPKP